MSKRKTTKKYVFTIKLTLSLKEIYSKYKQIPVYANRMINSKSDKRGKISEVVIVNY